MSLDLIQQTALDEDIKLLNAAMTKEEFFALAEKCKRHSAGSGFLEWGKSYNKYRANYPVNDGIWCHPERFDGVQQHLHIGRRLQDGTGISRTVYPIALVNGVQHKLFDTNRGANSDYDSVTIAFPNAPDGTKTYDSATGAVVDFKKDVDPKYGDVATNTNEAVARAFEGMVENGDFRSGAEGWTTTNAVVGVEGAVFSDFSAEESQSVRQFIPALNVDSGKFTIEVVVEDYVKGQCQVITYCKGAHDGDALILTGNGTFTKTFDISSFASNWGNDGMLNIYNGDRGNKFVATVKSISIRPVTNKVITTRKDLVFLETWHEDLATNDLFNPLGNVQYGTGSFDGITGLANNLVAQGYSAFGEWDTATKGFGKRWSTMTAVEKIKAIQNPDNNIYYDAETKKYIQVKYRIRVIEGLGDDWVRVAPKDYISVVSAMCYSGKLYVRSQGSSTQLETSLGEDNGRIFYTPLHENNTVKGDLVCGNQYENVCAIPICLVQRLNQGAYHHVWNSEGCASLLDVTGSDWSRVWSKSDARKPKSTKDCFDFTGNGRESYPFAHGFVVGGGYQSAAATAGTIAAGSRFSGRPDQYKYYDAIYAGQVEDLRLDANKQDYNRLLEDGIRKAVAGKTRGKGKVPFIQCIFKGNSVNHGAAEDRYRISLSSRFLLDALTTSGGTYIPCTGNAIIDGEVGEVLSYYKDGSDLYIQSNIRRDKSKGYSIILLIGTWLTPEYDSLPWVDIIGAPENVAATFPNGVVGQWVPVIPDGTAKEFPFNRKLNAVGSHVFTTDNGATWSSNQGHGGDFSMITNARKYSASVNQVAVHSYGALSNFTAPANNSAVDGQVGDVFTTHSHSEIRGNRLSSSLINKVQTSASSTPWVKTSKVNEFAIGDGNRLFLERTYEPKHTPIALCAPQNNSPAVKTLYTLTSKDGLLYMQYHGNELKYKAPVFTEANSSISASYVAGTVYKVTRGGHKGRFLLCKSNSTVVLDNLYINSKGGMLSATTGAISAAFEVWDGSGWGDDSSIPVINGEGTKTNLSGETVKTFCHHELFPIGIADHTESLPSTSRYINFYAMKYVPHSLVQHYDEVDCIKGYDTEVVESICEFTGEPITTEVKVPIMGKELVRKPFYFENNGHIDEAEIDRHTQYVQAVDEYIEGLIEESESKTPQLMI